MPMAELDYTVLSMAVAIPLSIGLDLDDAAITQMVKQGTWYVAALTAYYYGMIAPEAYRDIIGVEGDPLNDVHVLQNVNFVMKNGVLSKTAGPALIVKSNNLSVCCSKTPQ